ncbi:SDR family NAD(P)-dependent oxidoreductase [Sulfitobacter mediterraneus]|uniref:SDR family NAD(P)-dependent oxidoreductase n=1 Tax=Sulfitobacter mediterraneus TaxID=83219 RepID=UPI0021A63AEA|nr:SDR family NAD(P)-dependent oxidoreductase [Sulfitobacter mediterraneus]UWR13428.1 SDR family NAD(P)-dependent oxidoreductase [Sulfitobacter mediterraneus]
MRSHRTVFVTGANRGLGLEFCRQYAADGWHVIAACRDLETAQEVRATGARVIALDVANPAQISDLANKVDGIPIDVLINNAGVMGDASGTALNANPEEWTTAFQTNVLGPALVTRALLANLKHSDAPVAVTIGSQAGIFDCMQSANLVIYRSTKAAAHAVTISLGRALTEEGILYFSLRPGRTATDMTEQQGDYTAPDSVHLMREAISVAKPDWVGKFIDRSQTVYDYAGGFHA